MIARIVELSLRQRPLVLLATLVLIGVGVWSATRLPIDAVPDITGVQVQINTILPALAPEEIEKQVTFPIETEMAGVPGLEEIRSLSKLGLSQVTMTFTDRTDIHRARQMVAERLQNAELPAGAQPRLAPISTGLGEIYFYSLDYVKGATNKPAGRREQLMELRQIHDLIVKPAVRSVPGVADVEVAGGFVRQVVVQPKPDRLLAAGVSFEELAAVVAENAENVGGGTVTRGAEHVFVRTTGRVGSLEEIAALPVKFGGRVEPLLVRDLANVVNGHAFRSGAATSGGEEAVVSYALMLTGDNSRLVAQRVHERMEEIRGKLPPGVALEELYNRSDLVNLTIGTVERNLSEGALLVVVILFALLGNWRGAVIVALAIPLSMLFAITGMVQLGISGNLMSLGAIDFGLIIDGAVVMVENIIRHLAEKRRRLGRSLAPDEYQTAVLTSAREVASPMFFGVVIITLVYVPLLMLGGIEGKMFRPMAWTVMLALGGALVLSLTLMPVLCSFLLCGSGPKPAPQPAGEFVPDEDDNWLVCFFKRLYTPLVCWALAHKRVVVLVAVALMVGAGWTFTRLGAEFVPQLDEGTVVIQMVRPSSISLEQSVAMQCQAEKILLQEFPEIDRIFSRLGTPSIGTDPMGVNLSDVFVSLKPARDWRRIDGRIPDKEELAARMTGVLAERVPGQDNLLTQPIEMRFNEMLEGSRADVVVKIYGNEFSELNRIATEVREILERIRGTAEAEFDADSLSVAPVLDVRPDRDALRRYGLHAGEVNSAVATAMGGRTVGSLVEGNRRSEIVVRLAESDRNDLERFKDLPVRAAEGGMLTLRKIAKFSMSDQVVMIEREGGQRRAGIMVNLRNRDLQGWVEEAREKIRTVAMPEGYWLEFGGQFTQLIEARQRLFVVVPAALGLILFLIYLAFGNARQAALIFACVPLAVTGGVFALWLRGLPFSITAAVGFIALSGIAVLNGIMLISFINQLRREGRPLHEAVVAGTLTRLRPKLMTALVASFGFVPMAISTGAGAEVQRPLATVVIGGIITSTFLTLLLLPVLYEWVESRTGKQASTTN